MSTDPLILLNPEWQGYGLSPDVYFGARKLAAELLSGGPDVTVDVPEHEQLDCVDGVLGLASIAARFAGTLAELRRRAPDRILSIGGTCGTELAPVAYLNERWAGRIAVVWLDAHGDLNTPATSPSGHFHGMVLRTLLGDGPRELTAELRRPLTPAQVFLVGARDLDPPELEFIAEAPITHVGLEAFRDPDRSVTLLRAAGFQQLYVHLDLDVIDPESFGGALLSVPGGPTMKEVETLLTALAASCDIVGFSMLEYSDNGAPVPGSLFVVRGVPGVRGGTGLFSTDPGQKGTGLGGFPREFPRLAGSS